MTSSNALAWNTKHILLNNLGMKAQSGNEIWPVYLTLQNKIVLSKYYIKKVLY